MTLLEQVMLSNLCLRLGWTLLHSSWQLAQIGVVIALVLAALRERPNYRHSVANLGIALMVAAPIITFLTIDPPERSADADRVSASVRNETTRRNVGRTENSRGGSNRENDVVAGSAETSESSDSLTTGEVEYSSTAGDNTESASDEVMSAGKSRQATEALVDYAAFLAPLWLAGVVLLALRQTGGWILARRVLRAAEPVSERNLLTVFESLVSRMRIRRVIRVLQSPRVDSPMVLGTLRATIVVPFSMISGLTTNQWEAILAHELAHVRRHDFALNLVSILAETILFYHPAVWWIARRARIEREYCCDDMATRVCQDPIALAEGLAALEAARQNGDQPAVALGALGAGRASLTRLRVQRILGRDTARRGMPSISCFAGLLVLAFVSCGTIVSGYIESKVATEQEPARQDPTETDKARIDGENSTDGNAQSRKKKKGGDPESWEISRLYDAAWLRHYWMRNEVLPKPVVVPLIRGRVVDPDGRVVEDADVLSHTPRHWAKLFPSDGDPWGHLKPSSVLPFTKTNKKGNFGLPSRTEPYRVLVAHPSGVASISHEDLINAEGKIKLEPWARVEGKLILDGEPRANERIRLYIDTLPWSYSMGGPRLTTEYETRTDAEGRYVFVGVPPLPGRAHHIDGGGRLARGKRYTTQPGKTTKVNLGEGTTIRGIFEPTQADDNLDWSNVYAFLRQDMPPPPYPAEIKDDAEAIYQWKREWNKTAEGQAFFDEQHQLMNLNYKCDIADDGSFRIMGVPAGKYQILINTRDKRQHPWQDVTVPADRKEQIYIGIVKLAE